MTAILISTDLCACNKSLEVKQTINFTVLNEVSSQFSDHYSGLRFID